ncbi:hypothetical protein OH77DRAFT_1478877 [Trametes cingulata]|nr:hypothetical protein OH77DRAFT_1478877 [Trametes cingulata]
MAAVASSSRPAGARPNHRQRKTDVFKPRFPLDPFAGASVTALGEPWFLRVDALLSATSCQRRNVIFVLGGTPLDLSPSLKELAPLLQSRHLAQSLIILATHNPPEIPHVVLPTVRILHLSAPLALEDAGAVRFVNVLEWAERVARAWRKHGGTGVLELSEELDIDSELTPPSVLRFTGSQSTPASPGSSSTHLSSESLLSSRPSSIFRPPSSSGTSLFRGRQTSQSLPRPDPSQRPFDVLINFLPDHVSDKALLKNSILVTTISRPFLVSNGPATPAASRSRTTSSSSSRFQRPQSIFNAFSRSASSVYLPPTPPYQSGESLSLPSTPPPPPAKALLVHLLPAPPANAQPGARRKLVESMESFLVSFAFQALSPGAANGGETLERARPYVMQMSTFCEPVGCEPGVADWGDWTVADVVLSGALDAEACPSPGLSSGMNPGVGTGVSTSKGKHRASAMAKSKAAARRAWIGAAADLVIMPPSDDASPLFSPDAGLGVGHPPPAALRPDSYFPHHAPRAFEAGRSTSAPLLSAEWASGRPHSHPQTSHSQSLSSSLSRQISPSPRSKDVSQEYGNAATGGLPTPPHSEESEECGSTPSEDPRSPGSSLSGSASGKSASAKSGKKHGWKFWRRLSHMPAAIKA